MEAKLSEADFIIKDRPRLRTEKRIKRLATLLNKDKAYLIADSNIPNGSMSFEISLDELFREMERLNVKKIKAKTCAGTAIYIYPKI